MSVEDVLALAAAVAVLGYLVWALVREGESS